MQFDDVLISWNLKVEPESITVMENPTLKRRKKRKGKQREYFLRLKVRLPCWFRFTFYTGRSQASVFGAPYW